MPRIKLDLFESLGEMMRPPPPAPPLKDEEWEPPLNPVQREIFDCDAQCVLAHGEKGSGKTSAMIHKVVKHCFENENALALILTPVKSMSEDGGAWHKLVTEILPIWAEGLGLHWKKGHDKQHNELVWVQNVHGSYSQIKGISAPHPDQLADRFPGREPSCVFVDELTKCSSIEYFSAPHAQLRRRPMVKGVQQYLAACNPEGPSHWVHKLFFQEPFNEETGEWNPNFATFYVPIADNEKNLPPAYLAGLSDTYSHDPIERARMIGGEWIDRASGESLFRDIYNPLVHVRPIMADGKPSRARLLPSPSYTLVIGLDPGNVHNAFVFMQWLPIDHRMKWVVLDEMVTIRKRIDYNDFIPMVMRRIRWLRTKSGGTAQTMPQVWISDNSAFNQYRSLNGSYDVTEIERIYETHRERYGLEPMRVKPAPKFNGSQVATVRQVQRLIGNDELIVSTSCPKVQKMFLQLESEDQKKGDVFDPTAAMTPKRSDHQHVFKALGYVTLMAAMNPTALVPIKTETQRLTSVRAA
jgi:Terminase large subunit, T4likevirus-type, N-terminal